MLVTHTRIPLSEGPRPRRPLRLIHPASCCLSAACLQNEIREPPNLCLLPRPVLSQHSPVRTLTATTASALGEPEVNREKAEQPDRSAVCYATGVR
eukprot:COSAG01_NODE_1016_length_12112_cov_6.912178_14_plen_96_part_00